MKTKRFLSIVLTLAMLVGMFPGMSVTASAADSTTEITPSNTSGTMTITLTIAPTHSVTITAGNHMTKTGTSGDAEQTGLTGAMTDVVYTADEGYYFPEEYSVAEVSGIKVTRNSYTQITVSGTPTADATITLTAPTAKTTPAAPTTAAAVDCTTSDNNDGKITGVTTAMEYKKSDAADWTAGTGSDITGLVPGTYYVRVKATETTNASTNQELTIKGFISYTVTFKVVNGKWNDETTADKTVTLTGYEGDTLKLAANQIPVVGTKPNDTYKAGSWDVTPSADTEITGATTYTYTYAQKDSISQTVTFKVVNGSWNDETTTDKTVTLTGYEGDTLKLAVADIPAVGTKPNDTYKAGSWDTTPSADTEITADTTYTYTYAQKDAISQTVTFKVVNGSWNDETTTDKTVTLTGYEGDTLKLTADQIPAVGTKPGTNYRVGSWNVTPSANTAITADTTYIYTYAQKDTISQTVTFKVVNGKWDDDSTADKTVTLTGYEGDTLKLAATDIPAVGTKPNDTYKAGSWDTTPSADTAITAATTYTYTYAAKEASVVTKAPEAKTLTYNGQAQELVNAGTATGGTMQYALGDANGATQPYTTSIPTGTNAGTYYVWYRVKGDSNHNDVAAASVTVTINKKLLTITAGAKSKVYGEKDPELTYDSTGLVEGDNITGSLTRDAGENAGTYAITQGTVTASDNYELSYVPALLTITKADSNTTAPTANELNYSGSAQELVTAGTPTGGTLVYSTDGESYNEMIPTGINAGEYTVYYKVIGDANHNDKVVQQVTVTILARTLDIKADEKSKTYGEDDPALTYTSEGLVEGDSITGALSRAEGENVGTYAIEQGTLTAGDNYIITYTGANLAITEAASSVTTEPVTKMPTYNGGKQTLVAGGEVAGGTMQYALGTDAEIAPTEGWSTSIPAETDAGTYYVWYRAVGDNNHSDVEATCVSVDIEKAAITITADDKSSQKGAELQELSWQVSGDYVSGDELGISASTTADSSADAGVYPITVSWNDNANYEATLISGKYTITAPEESGRVETKTIVADNVPSCSISNLTTELARSLATEEELIRVQNGENLLIYLDMENIDDSVSATDKSLVEAAVKASSKDAKVGMYLDLTLYKKVGDGAATKVTDTKESRISVTIEVPDSLKGGSDVTRTFYIIRVHDGATDILATTTETTITFETDKFSTYALAYSDKSNGSPSVTTPAQQEKAPKTGDNFPSVWLWALILAGGLVPVGYAGGRHKGLERK